MNNTEPTDDCHRPAGAGPVQRSGRRLPPLRDYTDVELLAEVARRRYELNATGPQWCDECEHFGGPGDGTMIDNPCSKGHRMLFMMPDGGSGVDYGYYKRWCDDRREKSECRRLTGQITIGTQNG